VDGYAATRVALKDALQATRIRVIENLGMTVAERIQLIDRLPPDGYLYAQKSVLAYVFEHVLRQILNHREGTLTGELTWSEENLALNLTFPWAQEELFPSDFLDFLQNILKPYEMQVLWERPSLRFMSSIPKNQALPGSEAA
jgi:hypothetical protein